ncbi:hypothetical protein [Pelagibaculum spongiae]|uniref:ATP-grasp domain-containing protein n=1 Tax=Pelagibaculum spongiae TaxID=2080658 RepID=A0A2V1GXG6_9GAMM|nr:hypothetical protein [Pelagibaculum spongiae]PVZ69688.1 hypothetical protein DC094_10330 [Pelagibaculum spongiae]
MITRILIVALYIAACLRLRAKPWLYFQLNAEHFNKAKGIFSKLDIDQLIPARWRLDQFRDSGSEQPTHYPVFIKPEWGQNSAGIVRADNLEQLQEHRKGRDLSAMPFLVQESATENCEFEIYVIRDEENEHQFSLMSITETVNHSDDEFPINGIYNNNTSYRDLNDLISDETRQKIWSHIKQINNFRVARFGMRANSIEEVATGKFHIIEINLFLPMPLYLETAGLTSTDKLRFLLKNAHLLAKVTRSIPKYHKSKSVFFRKLYVHRTTSQSSRTESVDRQKGVAL